MLYTLYREKKSGNADKQARGEESWGGERWSQNEVGGQIIDRAGQQGSLGRESRKWEELAFASSTFQRKDREQDVGREMGRFGDPHIIERPQLCSAADRVRTHVHSKF